MYVRFSASRYVMHVSALQSRIKHMRIDFRVARLTPADWAFRGDQTRQLHRHWLLACESVKLRTVHYWIAMR